MTFVPTQHEKVLKFLKMCGERGAASWEIISSCHVMQYNRVIKNLREGDWNGKDRIEIVSLKKPGQSYPKFYLKEFAPKVEVEPVTKQYVVFDASKCQQMSWI